MSSPSTLVSHFHRPTRRLSGGHRGPATRRLIAESLEQRCVLATVPVDADSAGLSLAAYVAEEQEMGPVAPSAGAAETTDQSTMPDPAAADQFFGNDGAEGEVGDETIGDTWNGGTGTANTAPILNDFYISNNESLELTGWAYDDESREEDLTVTLTGLYEGSISCHPDGFFSLIIDRPMSSGYIYATVTDGELTSYELSIYFSFE